MSIFQQTVIAKHIKSIDTQAMQQAYAVFKNYFGDALRQENIRNSKEEQFQEGFLNELFCNVLGYTLNPNPNYNLITENKNIKDSKKADGAIIINSKVKAVIELKGTDTTDLGKIETQAFGYKNNQPECVYVITSNFEKLRFYIDNAIEHLEFNLFTLSYTDFELLYVCLAYENLSQNVAKKIKEESVSEEDVITKKLYKDYSLFKRELHQNLVALNPQFEALELFKKSQKLLDRFLFLFFGEDRHLLPPNSVRLIVTQWNQLKELDEYTPLYERFKKYFGYLNTGYKGKQHDVFAYNGGLFKTDEILDAIKIDDELLYKHTLKLSEYDFASEVDVNILGHIFENSLNELDEIKAQLEGKEIDKTKTKRKKDGVFYTPKYITKYIVDNTVGKLCTEKKTALAIVEEEYFTDKKRQKKTILALADKLETYRAWLMQLTICDPACGSGAFLNQALDFLISEHRYIDELKAKLFGDAMVLSDIENSILENNLFGVDLNEESVEIAKLSLWLRTAQPNRKLNDLSNNIKCGNSLIDDVAVAGEKAFNWHKEFPQVFGEYVEVTEKETVAKTKTKTPNTIETIELDYKGGAVDKQAITNVDSRITNTDDRITNVGEPEVEYETTNKRGFDVIIGNPPYVSNRLIKEDEKHFFKVNYKSAVDQYDLYVLFMEKALSVVKSNGYFAFITPDKFLVSKYGIGILEHLKDKATLIAYWDLTNKNVFIDASVYPVIFNFKKQISSRNTNYTKADFIEKSIEVIATAHDGLLSKIENVESILFKVWRPLATSKNIIDGSNFVVSNGEIGRYYSNPLANKNSNGSREIDSVANKIIIKKLCYTIDAFYDEIGLIPINTTYCLTTNTPNEIKFVLAILNSKLLSFYARNKYLSTSLRGGYIELRVFQVQQLPIKKVSKPDQQPFIEKAEKMIFLNKALQKVIESFHRMMDRRLELVQLSNKLENWHLLLFKEFKEELEKKKIKLSFKDEAEWEEYFNEEKVKALAIKSEIDATDKAIDKMVYDLYELTEEEIKIVEGA